MRIAHVTVVAFLAGLRDNTIIIAPRFIAGNDKPREHEPSAERE